MSHDVNTQLMERAVILADELGGQFPDEVGAVINQGDLEELRVYVPWRSSAGWARRGR